MEEKGVFSSELLQEMVWKEIELRLGIFIRVREGERFVAT